MVCSPGLPHGSLGMCTTQSALYRLLCNAIYTSCCWLPPFSSTHHTSSGGQGKGRSPAVYSGLEFMEVSKITPGLYDSTLIYGVKLSGMEEGTADRMELGCKPSTPLPRSVMRKYPRLLPASRPGSEAQAINTFPWHRGVAGARAAGVRSRAGRRHGDS